MSHPLEIRGHHFDLHYTGVLYWEEQQLLVVSDVHLGKVMHFRKYGAAVPGKAILRNFEILDNALDKYQPAKLCFLGDLFHSHINMEWALLEAWRVKRPIECMLVAGNHDIISPLRYEQLGIEVVQEYSHEGFLFTHHPEIREGCFNFSGHIHPAVRLRGKGRQSLRLPCFFKNEDQMILPAFGTFTGSHTLKKSDTDEVFAIAGAEVIKI